MNRRRLTGIQGFLILAFIDFTKQQEHSITVNHGYLDSTPQPIDTPFEPNGFASYESDTSSTFNDASNLSSPICQSAYTCSTTSQGARPPAFFMGCSCLDYCQMFGSCCRDKAVSPETSGLQQLSKDSYVCASGRQFMKSVYMVTSCPSSYNDSLLAESCSRSINFDAPQADLSSTPVTDRDTGVTYRNIYCAICWGRAKNRAATWLWRYDCFRYAPPSADDADASALPSPENPSTAAGSSRYQKALDHVRRTCTLRYFPAPELATALHKCTGGLVERCPESVPADDPRQVRCSTAPTAYVYADWSVYRNADCALCDGSGQRAAAELRCRPPNVVSRVQTLNFALILTPETGGCLATEGAPTSIDEVTVAELCDSSAGRRRAYALAPRHEVACPPGTVGVGNGCRVENMSQACVFPDNLGAAVGTGALGAYIDNDTLVALVNETTALCFSCVVERYANFSVTNETLSVVSDGELRLYDAPLYFVDGDRASVCLSLSSAPSSMVVTAAGCWAVPELVSAMALCLSEVCLLLFVAAFAMVKNLRRFPGEMVLNQCIAFFLAFLLFLLRPLATESPSACAVLAVSIHYMLVAAFSWTAMYSLEIARALSFKISEGPPLRRRLAYYAIGWGAPLVCIALGNIADAYALPFRPRYGGRHCYIDSRFGNLILFMAPLCVFLSIDVAVYGFMVVKLVVIARQTNMARNSHSDKLWLCVKLIFSMGILWIFAVLASFTGSEVLYCIFSLLNALQGVFVFVVFVCKRDTIGSLRQRVTTLSLLHKHSAAAQSRLPSTTASSV